MKSSRSSLTLVDNKPPALTGGCMCGKVTYSSTYCPSDLTNCHCTTCRRLSGSPFLTFGKFPLSSITWTSSSSLKKTTYSDIADRSHCSDCGSPISMTYRCEKDLIYLTAGTFDEDSVRGELPRVTEHIFLKEKKGIWYDVPAPEDEKVKKYSGFLVGFRGRLRSGRRC